MPLKKQFLGAIVLALCSLPGSGALLTFNNRSAFNTAEPGLPVETFEAALLYGPGFVTCDSPVSSSSPRSCFPVGGLLPGVVYSAALTQPNLVVVGAGVVGNASNVLGPDQLIDTLNLTFAQASAAGFDVFSAVSTGNVGITVYNTNNVVLGSFLAPVGGAFFGVANSSGQIGRISINSPSRTGELIDNLAFGNPTPEPANFGLASLGAAALAVCFYRKSRGFQ